MISFFAALFISIHNIHVCTIWKSLKFVWHDLLCQICQWKDVWKEFQWCPFYLKPTVIIGICLVLINSCGSTASSGLEASLCSGKHTQWKKCCVKLVLEYFDDLLHMNIWNNTSFRKKVTYMYFSVQSCAFHNQQSLVIDWFLNQIRHKVANWEGLSYGIPIKKWLLGQISVILSG